MPPVISDILSLTLASTLAFVSLKAATIKSSKISFSFLSIAVSSMFTEVTLFFPFIVILTIPPPDIQGLLHPNHLSAYLYCAGGLIKSGIMYNSYPL